MTSDNLLKILGNREYLHQISYQELKSLVVQYPYSLSLRYLLGMKSRQEDNSDLERNIESLATYGIDRTHFFKLFNEVPEVLEELEASVLMQEDYLELKELSALERELDAKVLIPNNDLAFIPDELAATPIANTFDSSNGFIEQKSAIEIREPLINPIENGIGESENLTEIVENSTETAIPELEKREKPAIDSLEEEIEEVETSIEIVDNPLQNPIPKMEEVEQELAETDFSQGENKEDIDPAEISSGNVEEDHYQEHLSEILTTDGLPDDAVDVDDLYARSEKELEEAAIETLFDESEKEIIAEEAISDSTPYLENAEEVLLAESQLTEALSEAEKKQVEKDIDPQPEIPFEVFVSDTDPIVLGVTEEKHSVSEAVGEISSEEEVDLQAELEAISETAINEVNAVEEQEILPNSVVQEEEISGISKEINEVDILPNEGNYQEELEVESRETLSNSTNDSAIQEEEESLETLDDIISKVDTLPNEGNYQEGLRAKSRKTEATALPLSLENLAQVQAELNVETSESAENPQITLEELYNIESRLNPDKKPLITSKKEEKNRIPAPKKTFDSWSNQDNKTSSFSGINVLNIPLDSDQSLFPKRKKKKISRRKIKTKFKKTVAFAEESLKMSEGIASETLAQLLVRQGHYKKATKMFKQLCLIMPEKSSFFAGEIEKIQNLKEEDS